MDDGSKNLADRSIVVFRFCSRLSPPLRRDFWFSFPPLRSKISFQPPIQNSPPSDVFFAMLSPPLRMNICFGLSPLRKELYFQPPIRKLSDVRSFARPWWLTIYMGSKGYFSIIIFNCRFDCRKLSRSCCRACPIPRSRYTQSRCLHRGA